MNQTENKDGRPRSNPTDDGPCRAEAEWIVSRPEFEASHRLKKLLRYLSARTDQNQTPLVSQMDIARDVMQLGDAFDPSNDAHVRIEVARLRSALAGFYSRLPIFRSRRLTIPKGGYQTELAVSHPEIPSDLQYGSNADPMVALAILNPGDPLSQRYAFELECELLSIIANSPLAADQLFSIASISGTSIDGLADKADRHGACLLLVVQLIGNKGSIDAYFNIVRPRDCRIHYSAKVAGWSQDGPPGAPLDNVLRRVAVEILDPLRGSALKQIFGFCPEARISRLSSVFAFMSSQDRCLLPSALEVANEISSTSVLAKALSIDMSRASYCFKTSNELREMSCFGDKAEMLTEQNSENSWVNLAMGYMGIACARNDLCEKAIDTLGTLTTIGSQDSDFALLKTISSVSDDDDLTTNSPESAQEPAVFDTIRAGFTTLRNSTDSRAATFLIQSSHKKVFWVRAFQIAAFADSGQHSKARQAYSAMNKEHPGVEDYAERAISTMIRDSEISGRILAAVRQAAI